MCMECVRSRSEGLLEKVLSNIREAAQAAAASTEPEALHFTTFGLPLPMKEQVLEAILTQLDSMAKTQAVMRKWLAEIRASGLIAKQFSGPVPPSEVGAPRHSTAAGATPVAGEELTATKAADRHRAQWPQGRPLTREEMERMRIQPSQKWHGFDKPGDPKEREAIAQRLVERVGALLTHASMTAGGPLVRRDDVLSVIAQVVLPLGYESSKPERILEL
jgi:hypothetical protein